MAKTLIDIKRIKKLQTSDFSLAETQKEVFSIIESLCEVIMELQKENGDLRDEINHLKGEKGNPVFKKRKEEESQKTDEKMEKNQKKNGLKAPK